MVNQAISNRQKWAKASIDSKRKTHETDVLDDHLTKEQKIFRWYRERALDLSRRNRLLKYPDKGAKLEFDLPLNGCSSYLGMPAEVYVEFPHKKILDAEIKRKKRIEEGGQPSDDEDDGTRTVLKGEKLLNCISRLQRLSAKTFKEHGLNTLFLAVGEISWTITQKARGSADKVRDQIYVAPAMLIPVSLSSPRDKIKRSILEVDLTLYPIQINPVLLTWMQQNQLVVPPVTDSIKTDYKKLSEVLKLLKDSFQEGMLDASVSEKVYVGQFSFHGQQIYEDLKRHESQMLKHDFISSICGGDPLAQEEITAGVDDGGKNEPDDFFTLEDDFTIHDSDSSQTDAIRGVLSGKHMVVHGPPGTGKSQTIANIIANLLARKKKVLFVCEKQAALDVVYRQKMTFPSVNLADLCLPLYEYRGSRKTFARDLINSRDRVLQNLNEYGYHEYDEILEKRSKRLEIIRQYAHAVITPIQSLQRSPYWVFGELAHLGDAAKEIRVPWGAESVLETTRDQLDERRVILHDLNQYKGFLNEQLTHKWRYVLRKHSTAGTARSILSALKDMHTHLKEGLSILGGQPEAKSIEQAAEIISMCGDQKQHVFLDSGVFRFQPFVKMELSKARALVKEATQATESYQELMKTRRIKKLPSDWSATPFVSIDAVSPEVSLPALLAPSVHSALSQIMTLLNSLPQKLPKPLIGISLKQYQKRAKLYRLAEDDLPILSMSKEDLLLAQKKVQDVETLALQLTESESVLSGHGVHMGDLSDSEVSALEQHFATGYKTLLRVFSSTYKRDRFVVEQWCIGSKPDSFRSIKELVESAANRMRSKRRYEEELKALIALCKFPVKKAVSVAHIKSTVEAVQMYLELCGIEQVEPEMIEIAARSAHRSIAAQIATAVDQLLPQWSSVLHEYIQTDIETMTLPEVHSFMTTVHSAYERVHFLYPEIQNYLDTNLVQYTFKDLKQDVEMLNKASECVRIVSDGGISELIGVALGGIMTNRTILLSVSTHIESLESIRNGLEDGYSSKQLYSYCDAIFKSMTALQSWHGEFDTELESLGTLIENSEVSGVRKLSFAELDTFLGGLVNDLSGLEEWMRFQQQKHFATDSGLGWFIDAMALKLLGDVPMEEIYLASFYAEWLDRVYEQNPSLKGFDVEKHERIVQEFRDLDKQSLKANRMRILNTLKGDIARSKVDAYDAERVIRREAEKSRQHKPIRELVENYAAHIQAMKPCWMVSPLTIGSYLKYGSVEFDVVIFDEASQMTVENALGAIARAKQVVVIGDEHQLPPTPFFNFMSGEDDEEDDEITDSTGYESILKSAISLLGGSKTWLKYHYRSKSEDLIAFSNHYIYSYYNQPLITFPSAIPDKTGIEFIHVPGVYKYDGERNTNRVEAEKIAELCILHAKTSPEKSLGIIAFSVAQEEEIRDTLQTELKKYLELQPILDEESEEQNSFFITNLESVQGDQRDVVMLSICYGKDRKGTFAQRFGPLNSAFGYRRLNVAVTRAREKLICVASIHAHDIKLGEGTKRGVELLQKYLEYAKDGMETLNASKMLQIGPPAELGSEFEAAVEAALQKRGYLVQRQVGASGYRIDLAVVHPENKNRYILGIECDGAAYHSSHSARERDRIRQDVLEAYGWRLYRIWSQHWFEHREDVLDDIDHEIKKIIQNAV